MSPDGLIQRLLETGLLQPGIFEDAAEAAWQWRLDMLPSYPDLLATLANGITDMLQAMPIDRLVCSPTALPLGVLVSAQTHLPLVYSRGQGESAVYDLVGAYDIGHPACLLMYQSSETDVERIIHSGASVGLNITAVIVVVEDSVPTLGVPLHVILGANDIQNVLRSTFKNSTL
jgi:hypothetical protein